MQTAKPRLGNSPATPRTARKPKASGADLDSMSSPNSSNNKTLKSRSPKPMERGSPKTPISEKKRPSRVSELESQLTQIQEELKTAREQLNASELKKKCAQKEAEDMKQQLSVLSAQLEESQQQLFELTDSEDARLQELRKLSQERDKAWQAELEAVQQQNSFDTSALSSAMNEIQRLKKQLEMTAESEAAQTQHVQSTRAEIQSLKIELSETLDFVQQMREQVNASKDSEARALQAGREMQMQLEALKADAESVQSDYSRVIEAHNKLVQDLDLSNAQVGSMEKLVSKLQADLAEMQHARRNSEDALEEQEEEKSEEETEKLMGELDSLKKEVNELRSALETSEQRYQEEYIQSTLQIRNAYDAVERAKSESSLRELELEAELKKALENIEELKSDLSSKQAKLQNVSSENEALSTTLKENEASEEEFELRTELMRLEIELTGLKSALLEKETRVLNLGEENETMRSQIGTRELEKSKVDEEAVALAEAAKAAKNEAQLKLVAAAEEADMSRQKAARVAEQLEAAQTVNTGLEAELRRLKVQADQWRKAAEAAAAMLSPSGVGNGKMVDRTASLDSSYHNNAVATMDSPFSDDMDDESLKKKNSNMLKKIGGLWRKGQKP